MSCNPNAELSSLDYAEMPLTFNSVETISNLNDSVAFKVDRDKVFKEGEDILPVVIDETLSYVPWGGDNEMPYDILRLIECDETLATCQIINGEGCYNRGLEYSAAMSTRREPSVYRNASRNKAYFLTLIVANLRLIISALMW